MSALVGLGTVEFVSVMQRVVRERSRDHAVRYFETRYALAVCVGSERDAARFLEIDFVAYPTGPSVEDDLCESGTCGSCGYSALSTAKAAECGVCGASVSLALTVPSARHASGSVMARV